MQQSTGNVQACVILLSRVVVARFLVIIVMVVLVLVPVAVAVVVVDFVVL